MVRITIEREECTSCALCWETCPEVFEENPDDTLSQIVEEYRRGGDPAEGEVSDDMEDCVRDAAEGCPVEIIRLS
ncbi:ferredoxin [uncultured Methanofollis sp.]|uniref:ferredoxin n=1 Tax=uncultured Methanofollis sp. TaxID=262500 RepID=UPI00262B6E67|nr:ferredoxin [uncultured Methanofollis sp.]